MELILERELDHQKKAVDSMMSALDGISVKKPCLSYENPSFNRNDPCIISNISKIQKEIRADYRGCRDEGNYLNLDVKMETGTGKTLFIPRPFMRCTSGLALINLLLPYRPCL